jgi:AraC-like DNA-binding protein/mannose-6-phosphate isomerase-like protein (cupin superfamily)
MVAKSSFSPPPGLTDDRTNDIVCWIHTLPHQATRQMHTHPFGEFFYCYAEGGTQIIPDGIVPMKVGEVYYFPPGQPHIGNGLPNVNAQCIVLYLPTTVFSHLNNGDEDALRILQVLNEHVRQTSNRIPLSRTGGITVRNAMLAVIQEGMQGRPAYRCAAKVQLQQMLLTIMRDKAIPSAWVEQFMVPDRDQRMTEVCRYLQTHFMHPIAVSQLASMSFLGLSQFHAIFKKEIGCTAVQYLTSIRMHHARQMLGQTQHGIAQVAQRCGYDCLGHFYDVFKTHYGMTPRQMRLNLTGSGT